MCAAQRQRRFNGPSGQRRFQARFRNAEAGRWLGWRRVQDHFEYAFAEQCRQGTGAHDASLAHDENASRQSLQDRRIARGDQHGDALGRESSDPAP